MFKVIKINKCAMTSFIDVLNLATGTVDSHVFDDSRIVSNDNFEFMQEGKTYDCKMELFGDFVEKPTTTSIEVTIFETGVVVGNTKYFKVLIGNDIYYILESDATGITVKPNMHYQFTRKDLIQVDDVIHADCL